MECNILGKLALVAWLSDKRVSTLVGIMLLVALLLAGATVQAVELDSEIPERLDAVELGMEYFEDVGADQTLAELLQKRTEFTEVESPSPTFGFSDSAYWLKIDIDGTRRDTDDWVLHITYPLLDSVEVTIVSDGRPVQSSTTGDSKSFDQRLLKSRAFAVPVNIISGREKFSIYVRVESSSSMQLPVYLMRMHDFYTADHDQQITLGVYYGVLLAILLFNLFIALGMSSVLYMLYSFYVASYFTFQVALNGLGFEYIWPSLPVLNQHIVPASMCFSMFFACLFSHRFLEISSAGYFIFHRLFQIYIASQVVLLVGVFLLEYQVIIKILTLVAALGGLLLIAAGVYVFQRNGRSARFYLLAWSFFLLGVLVYAAKTLGYLPSVFFTEYAIQIGSALEMILLSYALADRFNRLHDENERIQKVANQTLERKVHERTNELSAALERLSDANKQLETLSNLDTLTGVYNRKYFNQRYKIVWDASMRSSSALSVLMIDIDHFKSINDSFGHLIGDQVIVECAKILQSEVYRSSDFLARIGGEEFVVVLSATAAPEAILVAERLRQKVVASNLLTQKHVFEALEEQGDDEKLPTISVSIGVAALNPDIEFKLDRTVLVDRADTALYEAKNSGRNCVREWTGNEPEFQRTA